MEASQVEKSLIGAMLTNPLSAKKASLRLVPSDFDHDEIATQIFEVSNAGEEPTIPVIADRVSQSKGFLLDCAEIFVPAEAVEGYLDILIDRSKTRAMMEAISSAAPQLQSFGSKSLGPKLILDLKDIVNGRSRASAPSLKDIGRELYDRMLMATTTGMLGLPSTGIDELDRNMGGAEGGDLIIIAGRPGMGKSILGTTIVKNMTLDHDMSGLLWSLEMTNVKQMGRMVAASGTHTLSQIQTGNIEADVFERDLSVVTDKPIVMLDKVGLTVDQMVGEIMTIHERKRLNYLIIDHGGLIKMDAGGDNSAIKKGKISKRLKELAKDLDIPVFLLWQLSRSVETRGGNKRPMLSDLRDSGEIEEDADKVMFLYRDEYYGIDQDEDGNSTKGVGEINLAKCRDGIVGTIKANWNINKAMYTEWEDPVFGEHDQLPLQPAYKQLNPFGDT